MIPKRVKSVLGTTISLLVAATCLLCSIPSVVLSLSLSATGASLAASPPSLELCIFQVCGSAVFSDEKHGTIVLDDGTFGKIDVESFQSNKVAFTLLGTDGPLKGMTISFNGTIDGMTMPATTQVSWPWHQVRQATGRTRGIIYSLAQPGINLNPKSFLPTHMDLRCDGADPQNTDVDQAYANGNDAERANDNSLALCWYRIAADKGSAAAMGRIGFIYDSDHFGHGLFVTMRWYKVAAEGSNSQSIVGILQMHDQGRYPVDQAWGQSLFDQLMKLKAKFTPLCNDPRITGALLEDLSNASSDPGLELFKAAGAIYGFYSQPSDMKFVGAGFVRSDDIEQFVCELRANFSLGQEVLRTTITATPWGLTVFS